MSAVKQPQAVEVLSTLPSAMESPCQFYIQVFLGVNCFFKKNYLSLSENTPRIEVKVKVKLRTFSVFKISNSIFAFY